MEVIIPFGKLVKTANLKTTVGTIVFEESTKVASHFSTVLMCAMMPIAMFTVCRQGLCVVVLLLFGGVRYYCMPLQ